MEGDAPRTRMRVRAGRQNRPGVARARIRYLPDVDGSASRAVRSDTYNLSFRLQRTSVRQGYRRGVSGVGAMRNRTPASLVFALGLVVGLAGPLALLAFR